MTDLRSTLQFNVDVNAIQLIDRSVSFYLEKQTRGSA